MRLAGITDLEAANRWLATTLIPDRNARFAVVPEQPGSAFVPDRAGAWCDILCLQEERQVGNDNTVKWKRLILQLPASPLRPHFVRATVRVHEYPDGRLAVFYGPHRLADYAAGQLRDPEAGLRDPLPQPPARDKARLVPGKHQKRSIHALQTPVNLTRSLHHRELTALPTEDGEESERALIRRQGAEG